MSVALANDPLILKYDDDGVLRVAGTRVTLDTVIQAYSDGASAEEIAVRYDSLTLADVHATIAYYLRHKAELDRYLEERKLQGQQVRDQVMQRQGIQNVRELLTKRLSPGS
jgi:uncharacterized protein (DUF433 family)